MEVPKKSSVGGIPTRGARWVLVSELTIYRNLGTVVKSCIAKCHATETEYRATLATLPPWEEPKRTALATFGPII